MFRKVSQWLTDKGDQFVRGGAGPQNPQEDSAYLADADQGSRPVMDPFNDGDQKYGGRQPYRSRAELEAEAAHQAQMQAQQEAEAYQAQLQAQYQAQQEQMQHTGSYQAQAYQQPQQAQYQPQPEQQNAGYQAQVYQQPQQAQYQPQPEQQNAGYQAQQYQQQAQYQQQPQYQAQGYQQQQMQGSNVVTFPGMQSTPEGMVYAHVEYIVQLCSRNECRKVIDYIRTNASVFLNMEMIADGSERQRCVDMLSGAAYALGCALNKISPRGVYLISSPSVRVMMDTATQKLAAAPEVRSFARQSYVQDAAPQPRYASQPQQQPPVEEEPEENLQSGGFSSGSPTQRFQSQGAQGMSVSFGTAMAGSHTSMHRAINAQRYNAQ